MPCLTCFLVNSQPHVALGGSCKGLARRACTLVVVNNKPITAAIQTVLLKDMSVDMIESSDSFVSKLDITVSYRRLIEFFLYPLMDAYINL